MAEAPAAPNKLGPGLRLRPRTPARSLDELLAGATQRTPFHNTDGKSGSRFERVVIDGERYVLKLLHVDDDWIARSLGDIGCRSLRVWTSGLLDALPPGIDHSVVGAAAGLGRHGWGAALLMHDVTDALVAEGDEVLTLAQHAAFMDGMAALASRFWGWTDDVDLLPLVTRLTFFGPGMLAVERERGWPDPVPRLAGEGWQQFDERAPADVRDLVAALRRAPWRLAAALQATPSTFLHGDWKLGNLGTRPDGRTILLDWAYPGAGPICHDLAWYLAINRARLPESKEATIARFRRALRAAGVDTGGWWDRQLGLCLLGALVQFGWEKALGPDHELAWWTDAARRGADWL